MKNHNKWLLPLAFANTYITSEITFLAVSFGLIGFIGVLPTSVSKYFKLYNGSKVIIRQTTSYLISVGQPYKLINQ